VIAILIVLVATGKTDAKSSENEEGQQGFHDSHLPSKNACVNSLPDPFKNKWRFVAHPTDSNGDAGIVGKLFVAAAFQLVPFYRRTLEILTESTTATKCSLDLPKRLCFYASVRLKAP